MGTRQAGIVVLVLLLTTAVAQAAAAAPPTTAPAVVVPFGVAHDAPLDAVERLVEEHEDHTLYRVEFNGIQGDRVPAYVYVPKNGRRAKHPAVLLQYGSGGNKTTYYIVALGKQFVSRGFMVITIDVPRRGERKRRDGARGFASLFAPGTIRQTLGDYGRAIDYLETRPDVDRGRIGYAGISLGAITGLTFVAHEPRVRAMASIVGGANLLGMLKVEISPSARAIAERIDPFYHVASIAPRPLLLLNATRDQLVPRFFGEQLHKAAGEHAKKMWVETDHFFRNVDREKVMETVVDFMRESLDFREEPPADARRQ
jgi:dienelactone hydrolase